MEDSGEFSISVSDLFPFIAFPEHLWHDYSVKVDVSGFSGTAHDKSVRVSGHPGGGEDL
jgi:hypothetical protein